MASPKVRTDYEEMKQLVSGFKQAGEASQKSLQAIRREKDVLQGGDWVGKGATAFYKEMDDSVLPTLNRLVNALNSAASTTSKISSLMKQAEDEASGVFKGEGGGAGAAGGLGGALGGLGGGLAATGGAAGGALGGLGGALGGALGGLGAAGGLGGALGGGLGGLMSGLGGSLAGTPPFNDAVNSLDGVSDADMSDAMDNLGDLASQYDNIIPPGYNDDTGGVGPILSTIGSPNGDSIADQIVGQASGGGGGGDFGGGGSSGGGGSTGGGGSSGGGGGGGSPTGGASPNIGGFSDAALQSIMTNPNLPASDKLLASAIQTLRRDPNAFNGALSTFVNQALAGGGGGTGAASQAVGGGLKVLAGALASGGTNVPQSAIDSVNSLQQQFNNIIPAGGGAPLITPVAAGSTPPPSTADAIMGLVQQITATVSAIIPAR